MPSNVRPPHGITRQCAAAALLFATVAGAQPALALQAPQYVASITVQPDIYTPGETLNAGAPWGVQSPHMSYSPVTYRLTHTSFQGTGSIGNASANAEHGGTVRVTASTADEIVGSSANLNYEFTLAPKAGVTLPSTLPLHVLALGGTGTDGYATTSISFVLNYRTAPKSAWEAILVQTGSSSDVAGHYTTFGGNGEIHIDQVINVAPNTVISVSMGAQAGAGTDFGGVDVRKNQYGTGSAWVDPVFTLPDEWLGLVDIVGVPMASTVPEPSISAMALVAAGLSAASMRRRSIRSKT